MYRLFVLSFLLLASVPLFSFEEQESSEQLFEDVLDCIRASNDFCFEVYKQIEDRKENLSFSPYALYVSLGKLYLGSEGQTSRYLEELLQIKVHKERWQKALDLFRTSFGDNKGQDLFRFYCNDAQWVVGEKDLLSRYSFLATKDANDSLEKLPEDVSHSFLEKKVNHWLDSVGGGYEKKGFSFTSSLQKPSIVSGNAFFLSSQWKSPFPLLDTEEGSFYIDAGMAIKIPMMSLVKRLRMVHGKELMLVELPLKEVDRKERFVCLFMQPGPQGLKALEESLNVDFLEKWRSLLRMHKVKLNLPRLSFETSLSLASFFPFLQRDANFSLIREGENLSLSEWLHWTRVSIDEDGIGAKSRPRNEDLSVSTSWVPRQALYDQPFLFFVLDKETGMILLMGKVMNL